MMLYVYEFIMGAALILMAGAAGFEHAYKNMFNAYFNLIVAVIILLDNSLMPLFLAKFPISFSDINGLLVGMVIVSYIVLHRDTKVNFASIKRGNRQ